MTAPAPILVLAPAGTPGATLAAALGQGPESWGLPELHLEEATHVDHWLSSLTGPRAALSHGLLRALCELLAGEQSMAAVEMARRWLMRRMAMTMPALAQELQAMIAPRRMVTSASIALFDEGARERLHEAFPQARLVALQMHPLNHSERLMSQQNGLAGFLLGAIDRSGEAPRPDPPALLQAAEEGLEGCRALWGDDILTCRVEDLAQSPAAELERLAEGLGLPADEAAVAAMSHPETSPFTGPGPLGAHVPGDIVPLTALKEQLAPRELSLDSPSAQPNGIGLPDDLRNIAAAQGYG
ncbi:hypothetical protein ACXN5S_02005 [Pseudoroseicyclus sp. H15]